MIPLRPLAAAELLTCWELGQAQTPLQRPLTLLAAASPGTAPADLARLSVGRRDACLMTLRAWAFGPSIACVAACPACGERLDLAIDTGDIRVDDSGAQPAELAADYAGHTVRFRLPDSSDLLAVADCDGSEAARRALLARCILGDASAGGADSADELPAGLARAVAEGMARADPQADVRLAMDCPACDHKWRAVFDIAAFFWTEIGAWAGRMLYEVHMLASAYGWSEGEILALSPLRRQRYLEMVGL